MNAFKTTVLLAGLAGLLVALGGYFGGQQGAIIAFVIAGGMNLFAYLKGDKLVLARYGAQPVSRGELPELWRAVDRLCERSGLPEPKVYYIDDPQPNAFATGRGPENASIAVTDGLLRLLNTEELEGVVAHELAHIANRDTLTMVVTATIAGAISLLAQMAQWAAIFGMGRDGERNPLVLLVTALIAPIAATVIQLAISRQREFAADKIGAHFARSPHGLASALQRLESAAQRVPMRNHGDPATAHLFIVNPLAGKQMAKLFSTHPPIEERVARLRALKPEEYMG